MYTFIGGTPAAGKSTLARKVADSLDSSFQIIGTDDIRDQLLSIPKYEKWVNIYWNMDEKDFMSQKTCTEKMDVLVAQSEALFPPILDFFNTKMKEYENIIFEGVTLLPHLARKHLPFEGIYLVIEDRGELLKRLKEDNRWGNTDEMHKLEADYFLDCEVKFLRQECDIYRYKIYNNTKEAESELIRILTQG
jgi:2-phosphoglycerate kinase